MATIRANIMRLPASPEGVIVCEISIEDISAQLSTLFPQLLKDNEKLHETEIQVFNYSSILDNSSILSEVICHDKPAFLTFIMKPYTSTLKFEEPVSTNLSSEFIKRAIRNHELLFKMLLDKKWCSKLIENCPAVGQDRLAFALLQDRFMLECVMKDKKNVQHLLFKHPSLYQALEYVNKRLLESVNEQAKHGVQMGDQHKMTLEQDFSLHQFNVAEDENEEDEESENEPDNQLDGDQASRLMQMLSNPRRGASRTSSNRSDGTVASSSRINPEALRAALSQTESQLSRLTGSHSLNLQTHPAETAPATASTAASEPMEGVMSSDLTIPSQRWSIQLSQLAEMGITDTAVALQALDATEGNLELAFSILFG